MQKYHSHLFAHNHLHHTPYTAIVVSGRITRATMAQVAEVKARAKDARAEDRSAYQGAIYRVEIGVEFDTILRGRDRNLLPRQQVQGYADFPRLPDIEIARQEAMKQAAFDAAARIVSQITEAW